MATTLWPTFFVSWDCRSPWFIVADPDEESGSADCFKDVIFADEAVTCALIVRPDPSIGSVK